MKIGQMDTGSNYIPVNKNVKSDKPVDGEKVEISGNQADSEMEKASNLREMHKRSSLYDNLKEVVVGIVDGTSKTGTICGIAGAAITGGAAILFGAGALAAAGVGALGFVVGGYAGIAIDFMKHPF